MEKLKSSACAQVCLIALALGLLASCSTTDNGGKEIAVPDWSDLSHGSKTEPDYATVFPQSEVGKIEITMAPADWAAITNRMDSLTAGTFGSGKGNVVLRGETDYVAVSLKFKDKEWYKVGFRLKGHSSLGRSWRSGTYKLPFRLHFDRYEEEYPAIVDQRFYGFKELSMSPGAGDNSLVREKIGSDLFRLAGVPSPQTAFYQVYINFGEGLKYCGVYTAVEVVDDTLVKSLFGSDSGNIYKPESNLETFKKSKFEKKNHKIESDYTDVESFLKALHSPLRKSNAAQWREELEKTFDVNGFLRWLAMSTIMTNWDSYGALAHNYYLYNDSIRHLSWISWDHNEVLRVASEKISKVTLDLSKVTDHWPLIRYLADDPVYFAQYKAHVKELSETVFVPEKVNQMLVAYHSMISPYVIGPVAKEVENYTQMKSMGRFTSELENLKEHVLARQQAVEDFLH